MPGVDGVLCELGCDRCRQAPGVPRMSLPMPLGFEEVAL